MIKSCRNILFLNSEEPKSAAKDTDGLAQPHYVTVGLDVGDVFQYFTFKTSFGTKKSLFSYFLLFFLKVIRTFFAR